MELPLKLLVWIIIFIVGELLYNYTISKYLKFYFKDGIPKTESKPFLKIWDISTFKGIFERMVLSIALILGLSQILIVFGALKLGTRLDGNKDKVQNDYFLLGNLSSIIFSIGYMYTYNLILGCIHN